MHLFHKLLADKLNEAGLSIHDILSKPIELDWTPTMVKEVLWRQTQMKLYNKASTTELTTTELSNTYEMIDRCMREVHHIEVDWPSSKEDMLKSLIDNIEQNEG